MKKLMVIAGPCVIESEEMVMQIAKQMKEICDRLDVEYYFKASFDKANRTSISSFRGPGIEEGIKILKKVKDTYALKIVTDIHEPWQEEVVSDVVDIIQIPAFLCRQTDLLVAAAHTGKIINVKKAQFLAPWDMKNVVTKIEESGNRNIMLCERGTSFGYNTLVVDMRSFPQMIRDTGCPVIFDATHSVQQPGGLGGSTGGQREFAPVLARAAVAVGVAAVFMETHENPDKALSDGPNTIALKDMPAVLETLLEHDRITKKAY